MATHDYVIDNSTGANVRADLNNALQAIVTNNSTGDIANLPATFPFMLVADTTAGTMKIRNAANNAFIELFQLDGTLTLENGTNLLPALAFRTDVDTGIFRSDENKFNVATGGVERMELGTTTIFNETGADVDFRIEGDSNANLFYVDAGNDRVAVGTNTPDALVHFEQSVAASSDLDPTFLFLENASDGGSAIEFKNSVNGKAKLALGVEGTGAATDDTFIGFETSANATLGEKMRLDSSGRLLVGSSSAPAGNRSQFAIISATGNSSSATGHGIFNIQAGQGSSSGGEVGQLCFSDPEGDYAWIQAFADATTGSTDKPGRLIFSTTPDGAAIPTERLRIDSSGNVGIGTNSPTASSAETTLHINANEYPELHITSSVTGTAAGDGSIFTLNNDSSTIIRNQENSYIRFDTNGANERMRITNIGTMQVSNMGSFAATNPTFHDFSANSPDDLILRLRNTTSTNPYGLRINFDNAAPNDSTRYFIYCVDSSAVRFQVNSNGGIQNFQSNDSNLCDEREKKNIVSLETKWDKVKSWELKKFHYNEDANTDALRYGVIAQQVEEHCPEVLTDWIKQRAEDAVLDEDGNVIKEAVTEIARKGVKEQQMMWMAIKALQEAQTRIETLETKVAALEAA